ncbi:LTA synthase family protein [Isoalcanivorax beigongshangi]|uniref:LTA synthase family protein n=1 Tax=Isoalcanivorax beigongshangi TaxID=3238810 RepID=A0ABV4AH09_9GAMM
MLILLPWTATVWLIPANWWHFHFYNDVLNISSLHYGSDILRAAKSLPALNHIPQAFLGSSTLIAGAATSLLLFPDAKRRGRLILSTIAALLLVGSAAYEVGHRQRLTGMDVLDQHPVMGFLRSSLASKGSLTDLHVNAVSQYKSPSDRESLLLPAPAIDDSRQPLNVIIIILESVRASETGFYGDKKYTPNLDRIAKQGIVISDFYANSTQTPRAEMSILCGVTDFSRGAPFSTYGLPIINNCLPRILANAGYETLWFHGYDKSFFDRTHFLSEMGFLEIHDRAQILQSNRDTEQLGWGVSDVAVFDYAFRQLEQTEAPFMAEILTLSNHYPFAWEWSAADWPGAASASISDDIMSQYRNGIRYTDYALGRFWDNFQHSPLKDNTILIITGDHGVPIYDTSTPASLFIRNELLFRVPFVAIFPDRDHVLMERVASQVDIAPTLVDALHINVPTAFLGSSLLTGDSRDKAIFLAGSGIGYREGSKHCYSPALVCTREEGSCTAEQTQAELVCRKSSSDLLQPDQVFLLAETAEPTFSVQKVVEFVDLSHSSGFMSYQERLPLPDTQN